MLEICTSGSVGDLGGQPPRSTRSGPPRSLAESRKTDRTTPDEDPEIPAHLKGPDLERFLEQLSIRRDRGLPD